MIGASGGVRAGDDEGGPREVGVETEIETGVGVVTGAVDGDGVRGEIASAMSVPTTVGGLQGLDGEAAPLQLLLTKTTQPTWPEF
jgi:hypothetical protein